jgi:hypothetical protein
MALASGTESVSETAWAWGTALAWVWASPTVWASDVEWVWETGWVSRTESATERASEPASALESGRASDRASDQGSEEVSGVTELAPASEATVAESALGPALEWLPVAVATSSRPERTTCRYNS